MNMKQISLILLCGFLAFGLVACGGGSSETTDAKSQTEAEPLVGLSLSTLNNPFFVSIRDSAEAEATRIGVKLITVDAQDDPAKQIASIEDLIQKKVQVILLNPADSDAVANVVKQAADAGIKVISIDRSVNGAEVDAHIASDNVLGGKLAGEFILKSINNKGNIVELEGIPGASAARERGQGFHSAVDNQTGVKVVARQPADFDRAKGLTVMENILQANKKIQAVFAHNDEMALGAQKAIEAAGLKNVVIVGFDATKDGLDAVNAGLIGATIQQKPELMGKMGIETAKDLIDGKSIQKVIAVPLDLVTKNASSENKN